MPLSRIKTQMESSQLRLDSSAASTDVNDRVLLNGVDSSSTGDGYAVLLEDATANAFDGGVFSFSEVPIDTINPVLEARLSENQTGISHATYTKINLDQTLIDVGNFYDTANYRYTPGIPGYYWFSIHYQDVSSADVWDMIAKLYKNGVTTIIQARFRFVTSLTNEDLYATVIPASGMLYMNGVDDYVELYAYIQSEDSADCTAAHSHTRLGAYLVSRTAQE